MNTKYYLAVDIGASSGRHMLSHLENGKIVLEEIYRFPNGMIEKKWSQSMGCGPVISRGSDWDEKMCHGRKNPI